MKFYLLLVFICITGIASKGFAQCQGVLEVDLGADTTICSYDTLLIGAPTGYDFYLWNTTSYVDSINITSAGTYSVMAGNYGNQNLVLNGDFEAGTTNTANNFTTDYIPGTGGSWGLLSNEGQYAISTSPSLTHNDFVFCNDHTSGSGNMLVANGSNTANTVVWTQTVSIQPNTGYLFSYWATNVVNSTSNPSYLQLYINNVPIGDTNTTTTGCNWSEIGSLWNSGSATTAVLEIKNHSTATSGNDFAVDDIFFGEVCTSEDTIVVIEDSITVNAGPDISFCENDPQDLTANSNYPNADFEWNTTETTQSISPVADGTYSVTATSAIGCVAEDDADVAITEMDWDIDSILINNTNCEASDGYVGVLLENPNVLNMTYTWSGPGANSPNFINASVYSDLDVGWYYLEVTYDGCSRFDSAYVDINNAPVASFTATPTTGFAPQSVSFTNNSQNAQDFSWTFGNGQASTDENPQDQYYANEGQYEVMLIAGDGACTDTAYQTIILTLPVYIPIPEVTAPNVFTPDGDGANDSFYFTVKNINEEEFEINIFNRWGSIVYSSDSVDFKWDGSIEGNDAADGTYFYRYVSKSLDGKEVSGQGFLQLVRNK